MLDIDTNAYRAHEAELRALEAEQSHAETSWQSCHHRDACERVLTLLNGNHKCKSPWLHLKCGDCFEWE